MRESAYILSPIGYHLVKQLPNSVAYTLYLAYFISKTLVLMQLKLGQLMTY